MQHGRGKWLQFVMSVGLSEVNNLMRPNDVLGHYGHDCMSAWCPFLPSIADIDWRHSNVRFVLKADVKVADWVA